MFPARPGGGDVIGRLGDAFFGNGGLGLRDGRCPEHMYGNSFQRGIATIAKGDFEAVMVARKSNEQILAQLAGRTGADPSPC